MLSQESVAVLLLAGACANASTGASNDAAARTLAGRGVGRVRYCLSESSSMPSTRANVELAADELLGALSGVICI
jgi:hypothetical protein